MGLAVGVVGGRTEVEVGQGRTETEGFPEGWWIERDSQPSPATLGGSSKKRKRGVTARRSVPGAVWSEELTGPRTLASSSDPHQSGRALENRILTHLKQREETRKTTKHLNPDGHTKTRQSKKKKKG